jgi:hypothetical protein
VPRRARRPDHEHGVPGWHSIISGTVGFRLDTAESWRKQTALLNVNVPHRIRATFIVDLESPFLNKVRFLYAGRPSAVEVEIRVNGERDETASPAMAALNLPEPRVLTAVR